MLAAAVGQLVYGAEGAGLLRFTYFVAAQAVGIAPDSRQHVSRIAGRYCFIALMDSIGVKKQTRHGYLQPSPESISPVLVSASPQSEFHVLRCKVILEKGRPVQPQRRSNTSERFRAA